ncbi:CU044_5270 family protein [Streptomyces sp. NPDC051840]|uniref:CU044_5270 family protein n=1 Tax=Streptomyces sp. NPDC051840 TaxID=3154752 RepID=UPI003427E0CC
MDELTALRELEPEVPSLTDEARAAARSRLAVAMARERTGSRGPSRRLVLRTAFTATVAAAVTGVVVATTDGRGGGGPRTLNAAQVLHRAAERTRAEDADITVPRGDQYLYSREVYTRTMIVSGRRTTHTDEFWISENGSRTSRYLYDGRIKDEPPLTEHEVAWPPTAYAKLREMPADPDGLLVALGHPEYRRTEDEAQSAYMDLLLLMRGPRVLPPGLRAAAFEAFAKLPGIVIQDGEVDALGRRGIGVTLGGQSTGLVFERGTGAYLGLRQEGVRGARPVGKELRGGEKYLEVRALVASGVVDEIGQRPR